MTNAQSSSWTPERRAELAKLWEKGLSASEIGRRMGVTKNAVIGQARRCGCGGRASPLKSPWGSKKRREAKPDVETVAPLLLTQRPCSWPIGHPGKPGFHFCDAPALEGKSYCPTHDKVAHVKRVPGTEKVAWR